MGWVIIDRQLFDHYLWEDKPFSKGQAWIDLIGLANYEDGKTPYRGQVVTCKRGEVNRSMSFLAKRWGWSRKKVKAFIELLESDKMVTTKVTTHRTTITLVNYEKFQHSGTTKVTTKVATEEQQRNSKGSKEKRRIKNVKECKEVCVGDTHAAPTLDDVLSRAPVITTAEAQRFIDYNAATGWKVEWTYALERWLERLEEKEQGSRRPDRDPKQREGYKDEINWNI